MSKQLVILPGWGGSQETWHAFCTLAKEKIPSVTVIDLPCFGNEPCPNTPWGIAEYAQFVRNALPKESDDVALMGHSFGGQIAAYIAMHEPQACTKLILSGAAIYRPKKTLKRALFALLAKVGGAFFSLPVVRRFQGRARQLLYRAADSPDFLDTTSTVQKDTFKKVIREDISGELSKITIPTLLVWGTKDQYTPLRFGKKIAQHIPNAVIKIIPGGTHGLHISKKEELLSHILSFI